MSRSRIHALLAATLSVAGLLPAVGCASDVSAESQGWDSYGASIPRDGAMELSTLLADPDRYDGETVLLEAPISECCQAKGCWLVLGTGDQSVRVRFLDYGFFVPLDSAGRTVRLQGVFAIRDVPADEARHYLEDAGRHEEAAAITGPQRSFEIVASGVLLSPEA